MRKRAAETFNLDYEEMNERHHLTFDTYEEGKLSLDEYLKRVVFFEQRDFLPSDFRDFMFDQSQAHPEMLEFIRDVRKKHGVKVVAVSNEGRELATHRTQRFNLGDIFDSFVVSSFVHFRKPDADIYRIALDIAQASPDHVLYVEDRPMFVEVARSLGINSIRHKSLPETRRVFESYGLPDGPPHRETTP